MPEADSNFAHAPAPHPVPTTPGAAAVPAGKSSTVPSPGEPLLLTRSMRSALESAVRTVLEDPRVAGECNLVRLATVVLLAKSPVCSARVEMRSRDLAGWLGCSVSHVAHTVIPHMKQSGIASCSPVRDAAGRTTALAFELVPLREARAESGCQPLAMLNRRDLATLLRLCEAVTCPGWAPKDKPSTPAGFMAGQRGRGAATDRLTMLLLVLRTRGDGRVRMAPGRVADGYGRADATVARVLGCSISQAAVVVDRLLRAGALVLDRPETFGRDRLRIPAVAAASRRALPSGSSAEPAVRPTGTASDASEGCSRCSEQASGIEELVLSGEGWEQQSFEDALAEQSLSAFGDQTTKLQEFPQVTDAFGEADEEVEVAELHATHPPVATGSGVGAADLDGFSGSAVSGTGRRRTRAGASEDQSERASSADHLPADHGGPLRGEKLSTPLRTGEAGHSRASRGRAGVPTDLQHVLSPIAHLWPMTGRASTSCWLAHAVRRELSRLGGLVGPERAGEVLASRLQRRIDRQGPTTVASLQGWLLMRGLPQKPGCWSHLCDDGIRVDTGASCHSCACLVGDRRAVRAAVAATVAAHHPALTQADRRTEVERQLQKRVAHEATTALERRERTAQEHALQREAVQRRREALAAAEAARAARPCTDCGIADAGGLCLTCSNRRCAAASVAQAVDLVVALRADLDDQRALSALTEQVERDTWTVITEACAREGAEDDTSRAYTERLIAERLLNQRRQAALMHLEAAGPAEAEAQHAYRTALRRTSMRPPGPADRKTAEAASAKARARAARQLLDDFLSDLHRARAALAPAATSRGAWRERCAELAARPVEELVNRGDRTRVGAV
ncbi:hypothetical protein [Streptomyces sp. V1I6]|uniref:hypothetical protein n=1 Tax=Streptomyces sp. V1I6 TaxID=3042273 RepID=UPI0027D87654|nr:hypothetical protein [Streptomyces sp. V1I6]